MLEISLRIHTCKALEDSGAQIKGYLMSKKNGVKAEGISKVPESQD